MTRKTPCSVRMGVTSLGEKAWVAGPRAPLCKKRFFKKQTHEPSLNLAITFASEVPTVLRLALVWSRGKCLFDSLKNSSGCQGGLGATHGEKRVFPSALTLSIGWKATGLGIALLSYLHMYHHVQTVMYYVLCILMCTYICKCQSRLRFPDAGSQIHHCSPKAEGEGEELDPTNRCTHQKTKP